MSITRPMPTTRVSAMLRVRQATSAATTPATKRAFHRSRWPSGRRSAGTTIDASAAGGICRSSALDLRRHVGQPVGERQERCPHRERAEPAPRTAPRSCSRRHLRVRGSGVSSRGPALRRGPRPRRRRRCRRRHRTAPPCGPAPPRRPPARRARPTIAATAAGRDGDGRHQEHEEHQRHGEVERERVGDRRADEDPDDRARSASSPRAGTPRRSRRPSGARGSPPVARRPPRPRPRPSSGRCSRRRPGR